MVDTVRELGAFLHLKAAAGGWRVVVVDCADELNPNAANALLKLLEEPPAKALLLLVSHAPGRLCRRSARAAGGWPSDRSMSGSCRICWRSTVRSWPMPTAGC